MFDRSSFDDEPEIRNDAHFDAKTILGPNRRILGEIVWDLYGGAPKMGLQGLK